MKRFRGGLVFQAHRRVYHSTLGWRVIQKKKGPVGADSNHDLLSVPQNLVKGLECRVQSFAFRVWALGCGVEVLGFRVWKIGFRV